MLQYQMRTALGPWLVLVLAGVSIHNYFDRGMPWRGEPLWSAEWLGSSLLLWGPLMCGVIALDAANVVKPGRLELMASMSPSVKPVLVPTILTAGLSAAITVVSAIPYAFQIDFQTGADYRMFGTQLVVQLVIIAALAGIGALIGVMAGNKLGPMVGVAVGLALVWSGSASQFSIFALGTSSGSLLGLDINSGYLLAQVAGLVLMIVGVLAVLVLKNAGGSSRVLPYAIIGLLVAGYVVSPAVVDTPRYRQIADPHPLTQCLEVSPRICVRREHERFLDPLAKQIVPLYAAAQRAGIAGLLPSQITEEAPGDQRPAPGEGRWFPAPNIFAGTPKITRAEVIEQLVTPRWCAGLFADTPPSNEFWTNLNAAKAALATITSSSQPNPAAVNTLRSVMPELRRCAGAGT